MTRTQLREDDITLLAQEELYAPETSTGQRLGYFAIYVHACDVTLNSVNLNLVFFLHFV